MRRLRSRRTAALGLISLRRPRRRLGRACPGDPAPGDRRGGLAGRARCPRSRLDGSAVRRPARGALSRGPRSRRRRAGDRGADAQLDHGRRTRAGAVLLADRSGRGARGARASVRARAQRLLGATRSHRAGPPRERPRGRERVPGAGGVSCPGRRGARRDSLGGPWARDPGRGRDRSHGRAARYRDRSLAPVPAPEPAPGNRPDQPWQRGGRAAPPDDSRASRAPRNRAGRDHLGLRRPWGVARSRSGCVDPPGSRRRLAAGRRGRLHRLRPDRPDHRRARGSSRSERGRRHARRSSHRAHRVRRALCVVPERPARPCDRRRDDARHARRRPRRKRRPRRAELRQHRRPRRGAGLRSPSRPRTGVPRPRPSGCRFAPGSASSSRTLCRSAARPPRVSPPTSLRCPAPPRRKGSRACFGQTASAPWPGARRCSRDAWSPRRPSRKRRRRARSPCSWTAVSRPAPSASTSRSASRSWAAGGARGRDSRDARRGSSGHRRGRRRRRRGERRGWLGCGVLLARAGVRGRPEARSRRSAESPFPPPSRDAGKRAKSGTGRSAERASPRQSRRGRPRSSQRADRGLVRSTSVGFSQVPRSGAISTRPLRVRACSISARRCSRRSSRSPR